MGNDDLFKKRKARNEDELARRKERRETHKKILIICEGEKTEPDYFKGLIKYYQLYNADIEIVGTAKDPQALFIEAEKYYKKSEALSDPYNQIFCVFDKDNHPGYQQALDKISLVKPKNTFQAICSVPCFEYWLLSHFKFTTSQYTSRQLMQEIKRYIPSYQKNNLEKHMPNFIKNLDNAVNNSKKRFGSKEE